MAPRSSRAAWQAAVAAAPAKASLRPMKGTLLILARLMRSDGTLDRPRAELLDRVGVDARTLGRHLQLAVELGWLVRIRRGQKHVTAVYRAAIPDSSQQGIRDLLSGGLSRPPGYLLRTAENGGAHTRARSTSRAESEPSGEVVAVDESHDRRDDPPVGGGTTGHGGRSDGRPRRGLPQPLTASVGAVVRSTGVGPVCDIHPSRSVAVGQPQRTAAAAHQASADVLAFRGNHQRGRTA